jgi:enoyl-CoA hydratase/carnithine racemase
MLAQRAPLAQRFAKDVIQRSMGLSEDEALRLESRSFYDLGQTEDIREGTTAFREKREARFSGR